MRKKISLSLIWLLLFSLFPIDTLPQESEDQRSQDEKIDQMLSSPSSFDPSVQGDLFISAFNSGKVTFPQHTELAKKYLEGLSGGTETSDQSKIAQSFLSHSIGAGKTIDLGSSRISFPQSSDGQLKIQTQDGAIHDITHLSTIPNLRGVRSKEPGLELIFENTGKASSVVLIGSSAQMQDGKILIGDPAQNPLLLAQGSSATIEKKEGSISLSCKEKCDLSMEGIAINLRDGGKLTREGSQVNVEKGNVQSGIFSLAGSFGFSLRDGTLDRSAPIDLFKTVDGSQKELSFLRIKDPIKNDGAAHYGFVDLSTGRAERTVSVCLSSDSCDRSSATSDGIIRFSPLPKGACGNGECSSGFKASMSGILAASFDKRIFHESFSGSLEAAFTPSKRDSLVIDSCKECLGVVGISAQNNNLYRIDAEKTEASAKISIRHLPAMRETIPSILYGHFNDQLLPSREIDLYPQTKKEYQSPYNPNIARSVNMRSDFEFYSREAQRGNKEASALDLPYNKAISEFNSGASFKDILLIDSTSIKKSTEGIEVVAPKIYLTTSKGDIVLSQIAISRSGIYQDILAQREKERIEFQLENEKISPQERGREMERRLALSRDSLYFEEQVHKLSAIIEMEGKGEAADIAGVLRSSLGIVPIQEAKNLISVYDERAKASQKIAQVRLDSGLSFSQVVERKEELGISSEVDSILSEPLMLYKLNAEKIAQSSSETVEIYKKEGDQLIPTEIKRQDALALITKDASDAYQSSSPAYFTDKKTAVEFYSPLLLSSSDLSDQDKQVIQSFIESSLLQKRAEGVSFSKYSEGSIHRQSASTLRIDGGVDEKNAYQLRDGSYLIASPSMISLLKEGKIREDAILQFSNANAKYQQDEATKKIEQFAYALLPKDMGDVMMNLALGSVAIKTSAQAVLAANSIRSAALASARVGATTLSETIAGASFSSPKILATKVSAAKSVELELNGRRISLEVDDAGKLKAEEIQEGTIPRKTANDDAFSTSKAANDDFESSPNVITACATCPVSDASRSSLLEQPFLSNVIKRYQNGESGKLEADFFRGAKEALSKNDRETIDFYKTQLMESEALKKLRGDSAPALASYPTENAAIIKALASDESAQMRVGQMIASDGFDSYKASAFLREKTDLGENIVRDFNANYYSYENTRERFFTTTIDSKPLSVEALRECNIPLCRDFVRSYDEMKTKFPKDPQEALSSALHIAIQKNSREIPNEYKYLNDNNLLEGTGDRTPINTKRWTPSSQEKVAILRLSHEMEKGELRLLSR